MAKTPAQRGPFGNWLKRVREERYRTQADALAAMRRLAGIALSPSEYSQWEAGSRTPRPDNPKVARLYEFFGSRPTEPPEATQSGDDLADAIRTQAAAISALTAQMAELVKELRSAHAASADVLSRVAAVEAYAGEHERRFLADRQLLGLAPPPDAPTASPARGGARPQAPRP